MTMSGQIKDQGPVGLDEEEAKNEHVLLSDENESEDDAQPQPGISSLSTDHINPNQTSVFTYEDGKDTENDENTRDIEKMNIPKDSFSMLYVGDTYVDYILPISVFILQVAILVLILYNMLQDSKIRPLSNALNIPVEVPRTVTASQYIACLVSVISADDLIQGMLFMGKRIIPSGYPRVDGMLPPTISCKWEFSNIMRLVEGLLVIGVSFVFIVQSSTVIDLFLNFAGVTFVGLLDDIFFLLAENGLLGRRAKYSAKSVSNYEVYKTPKGGLDKKMKIFRISFFVGMTATLWAGLSVVVWQQDSMAYACQSLAVSVGGSVYPWARRFSGNYNRVDLRTTTNQTRLFQRAVYMKNQGPASTCLYYSNVEKRWVISWARDDTCDGIKEWYLVSFDAPFLCFGFEFLQRLKLFSCR